MKYIISTIMACLLLVSGLIAQGSVPAGIPYQAVARNLKGEVQADKTISIQVSILGNMLEGKKHYTEVHRVTTNAFGLFQLTIGKGKATEGEFAGIPWNESGMWLEIALDESGGEEFQIVNTSQFSTVPYAFHAETAGKFAAEDSQKGDEERSLYWGTFGNSNTFAPYQFLGTTDNTPLLFKTNNALAMEIEADGDVVMENDLEVKGTLNTAALNTDGLTVIGSGQVGPNGDHLAYFRNTEGGNSDGIAIKIDTKTSTGNNFVTFYNNSLGGDNANPNVAGRIEGFDLDSEIFTPFPSVSFGDFFNILDFGNAFSGGSFAIGFDPGSVNFDPGSFDLSLPSCSYDCGDFPVIPLDCINAVGALDCSGGSLDFTLPNFDIVLPSLDLSGIELPSFDPSGFFNPAAASGFANNLNSVVCWALENGLEGLITTNPFDLLLAASIVAATQNCTNGGVIYGATGADYAEWLERENPEEKLLNGMAVGVVGGKISKNTDNAEQILLVSTNPIVLGNKPADEDRHLYNKVGFMGQVPALVRGSVKQGDYILASGFNDGFCMAVPPDELRAEDLKLIVGRAWEDAPTDQAINMVNTSVGVKTNEWAEIFRQRQEKINAMKEKIESYDGLEERLKEIEAYMNATSQKD